MRRQLKFKMVQAREGHTAAKWHTLWAAPHPDLAVTAATPAPSQADWQVSVPARVQPRAAT